MGIDIYADGVHHGFDKSHPLVQAFNKAVAERDSAPAGTPAHAAAQKAVFKAFHAMNSVGYLREAYHGGPYVTRFLVREAFESAECKARIPVTTLRDRLPAAVLLAIYREHVVYGEGDPGVVKFADEIADDAALAKLIAPIFGPGGEIDQVRSGSEADELAAAITPEQKRAVVERIINRDLPPFALHYVDFVEQCGAHEQETGQPTLIEASY